MQGPPCSNSCDWSRTTRSPRSYTVDFLAASECQVPGWRPKTGPQQTFKVSRMIACPSLHRSPEPAMRGKWRNVMRAANADILEQLRIGVAGVNPVRAARTQEELQKLRRKAQDACRCSGKRQGLLQVVQRALSREWASPRPERPQEQPDPANQQHQYHDQVERAHARQLQRHIRDHAEDQCHQ